MGDPLADIADVPGIGFKTPSECAASFAAVTHSVGLDDQARLAVRSAARLAVKLAPFEEPVVRSAQLTTMACDTALGWRLDEEIMGAMNPIECF